MSKEAVASINMGAAQEAGNAQTEEANQYLEHIRKMDLTTVPEIQFAVGVVAEIKEKHAAVDEQRHKFIDPAQRIIDEANGLFKPALKSLKECEAVIKEKLVAVDGNWRKKRDELIAKSGEAGAVGDAGQAEALMSEADAHLIPKVPGLSFRRSVAVDVRDPAAAVRWCIDNHRSDLLQLNEKAVKALAKASDGQGVDIPGVAITPSATVAITVKDVVRE